MPAKSRLLVVCSSAVAVAIVLAFAQQAGPHAAAAPLAAGHTFVVNSTFDAPDADQADNICASAANGCTLRAAIDQANFASDADTITVPAGTFLLTRAGADDNNLLGDLDIEHDVAIYGAGPGATIIDGNGALTGDRVFQITDTAHFVTLSGITIRNGRPLTPPVAYGGGIYWTGSSGVLKLSNLSLENNQAYYGGGIYLDHRASGVVTLDNVMLHDNSSLQAGGGIAAAMNAVDARFVLRNSQVYSNTAARGGGIYLLRVGPIGPAVLSIQNTEIYSNTAGEGAGIDDEDFDILNWLMLSDSHVHHNHADTVGGGVENYGFLSLLRSTLDWNSAGSKGGGLYTALGAGLNSQQSTVAHNTAQFGGGVHIDAGGGNHPFASFINSTISGNSVSHQGGGLYANGGRIWSYNSTIAENLIDIPQGQTYPALGAGILLTASVPYPAAQFTTTNSIIADNATHNPRVGTYADDCFGFIHSLAYNLVETTTGCYFSNFSVGDITGQDPHLGPLQNNGGSTPTLALLVGSPAIDAGNPGGCTNVQNQPLAIDQRGVPRNDARCDIGAYEVATNVGQTIDFAPIANQTLPRPPFGITATASSGLTVSVIANTPSICTVSASSLNFLGVSAATVTLLNHGQCTLVAQQPGDATFNAASPVTQTFNVISSQAITFPPIPNKAVTDPPFAITATASSGLTVTFSANTPGTCSASVSTLNAGVSTAMVTVLNPGSCTLVAQQPGNGLFSAAPPVTRTFNVSAKLFLPLVVR